MKKSSPKLSLSRETLRSLEEVRFQLHEVQGAASVACGTESAAFSCDPASVAICPGSRHAC